MDDLSEINKHMRFSVHILLSVLDSLHSRISDAGLSDQADRIALAAIYISIRECFCDTSLGHTPSYVMEEIGASLREFSTPEEKEQFMKDRADAAKHGDNGCGNPSCKSCYPNGTGSVN